MRLRLLKLTHYQGGEGQFLANAGGALSALDFKVQVGEPADDSAEQGLSPAAGAFGGLPLHIENEVVLAQFGGGIFGCHAFREQGREVHQVYGVVVERCHDLHRLYSVVQHFVQFFCVGLGVPHAEIVVDFVGHDFSLGNHHGLYQVQRNLLTVGGEEQNLVHLFADQLGVGPESLGQVLAGVLVNALLEMGGNDRGNPVGHLVCLGLVVFLFNFARLFQGLKKLRVGGKSLKVQQQLALGTMAEPFGEGLGVVGLEGLGLAYHHGLFRTEHGHGIAGADDGLGDGGNVGVCGVQDLLGKRIVFPLAQGIGDELLNADVLGELVLAYQGDNHSCLFPRALLEVDDFEGVHALGGGHFYRIAALFTHEGRTDGALEADFPVEGVYAFGGDQLVYHVAFGL